jgi:hypothetical protein
VTVVSVVVNMGVITHNVVSIPETMAFVNEKISLTSETIFRATRKIFSGFGTMVFIPHTKDSDTRTVVPDTQTMVRTTNTMVEDDH